MLNIATASSLDLLLADVRGEIKYKRLRANKPRKSDLWLTQTKGIRTNTNRGKLNEKHAQIV